jgi:endonuclease/exonuclease/phosphatase (EEP) superfamily protein YafD
MSSVTTLSFTPYLVVTLQINNARRGERSSEPTFPHDTWFPTAITIDHVLTRKAEASSITTIEMPGSDHRTRLATIAVPLEPAARS